MSRTPIETILFDADGVLQTTSEDWFYRFTGLFGVSDDAELARLFADLAASEAPALVGSTPFAPLLAELLQRWQVDADAAQVLELWHHVELDAGMAAAVRSLRAQGVRCAMATNQHPERAAYMRSELGYAEVVEDLFISCELGLAKPDPAYFTAIVERLAVGPGTTLLIDDNADNVAGAREAGLAAELFVTGGGLAELDRILGAWGLTR